MTLDGFCQSIDRQYAAISSNFVEIKVQIIGLIAPEITSGIGK